MLRRRGGLTLIELLVVIAIVSVLVALLLPAIQQAREAARQSQCKNNLKQLGHAMFNYESTHGQFPVAAIWKVNSANGTINYGQSWGQALLPFLDQAKIINSFDMTRPIWSGAKNQSLIALPLPVFVCSSTPLTIPNTTTWSTATVAAGGKLNCNIIPATPITATWGRTDYIVTCDIRSPLRSNLISAGVPPSGTYGFFYCGADNAVAVVSDSGNRSRVGNE